MCDKIQLADFNDLFVLAVGLSMAYVIIEGKRQSSFYHILAKITDTIKGAQNKNQAATARGSIDSQD